MPVHVIQVLIPALALPEFHYLFLMITECLVKEFVQWIFFEIFVYFLLRWVLNATAGIETKLVVAVLLYDFLAELEGAGDPNKAGVLVALDPVQGQVEALAGVGLLGGVWWWEDLLGSGG
jgi:hypothetical protein